MPIGVAVVAICVKPLMSEENIVTISKLSGSICLPAFILSNTERGSNSQIRFSATHLSATNSADFCWTSSSRCFVWISIRRSILSIAFVSFPPLSFIRLRRTLTKFGLTLGFSCQQFPAKEFHSAWNPGMEGRKGVPCAETSLVMSLVSSCSSLAAYGLLHNNTSCIIIPNE